MLKFFASIIEKRSNGCSTTHYRIKSMVKLKNPSSSQRKMWRMVAIMWRTVILEVKLIEIKFILKE